MTSFYIRLAKVQEIAFVMIVLNPWIFRNRQCTYQQNSCNSKLTTGKPSPLQMLGFLFSRGNVIAKFVCLLKHYVLTFEFCSKIKLKVSFRLRPLRIWGKTLPPPPMGWDANWTPEPPWKWRWTEKSRPFWDLKNSFVLFCFVFQPGSSLVKQTTVWSTSVTVFCSCKLWYMLSEGRLRCVRGGFVVDKVALQD
jgi:hypothetical protein